MPDVWPTDPREGFGADALDYWQTFNGLMPGGAWRFIKCDHKRAVESWPAHQRTLTPAALNELREWRGNVGYPCGIQPGGWYLVIVDIDPRTAGANDSLAELRAKGMTIETVSVLTGGQVQGAHYWFRSDVPVRKAVLAEYPGVDFLGEGALVIVPPSVTVNRYEFEHQWTLGAADIAPLPAFLVEALTGKRGEGYGHDTPEALIEARALLERLGGHTYTEHRNNGAVWAEIVRPGKDWDGRGSATIGKLGNPGAVHVFSTNWPRLPAGSYNLQTLRAMVGVPAREQALVRNIPIAHPSVVERHEPPPEAPLPIDVVPTLPVFPVDVFPAWVREFVEQLALATQTPVDLPAMIVLAALAAASGGRMIAVPRTGWEEPTNLFVSVAMPPASRKSPVFRPVVEPLRIAERTLIDATRESIAEAKAEKQAAEQRARQLLTEASKAKDEKGASELREQAVQQQLFADAINVPTLPRILASDATPEALTSLLSTYGGRIAVMSAEGGVFDQIAGRYSGKPALDVYLNGHAGDALHIDRIGRPPEYIARPSLTIGITTQPSTFRALARVHDIKGRGLLGRFLWSLPASNIGKRTVAPEPVEARVLERYTERLTALAQSLAGWETDPYRVTFNVPAQVAVIEYERHIERELDEGGTLGGVREWGGKLVGHMVRIASLLHLAEYEGEGWRSAVTPPHVEGAIRVAEYLKAHALAVFDFMGANPARDCAREVLRWATHLGATFSARDARRAFQGRTRDEIVDALAYLVDLGHLEEQPPPHRDPSTRGRKPSPRYAVIGHPVDAIDAMTKTGAMSEGGAP